MMNVKALREDFDRAFAEPWPEPGEAPTPMLAVHAGGDPLALPVAEVLWLGRLGRVLPLPGTAASVVGLAGIRGQLVPVHALSALLGGMEGARELRWAVMCGTREAPVAFAFEGLDGYLAAPREALHPMPESEVAAGAQRPRRIVSVLRLTSEPRGVVDLRALILDVLPSSQKES
jgi:chemotaxis signal transduction protein